LENWVAGGVHFIQLREKDLDALALQRLAREMMAKIEEVDGNLAKLLVNVSGPASAELALAAGADGVHLAGKPSAGVAEVVRRAFRSHGLDAIISLPCHSLEDIDIARKEKVDLILFSPVFEKAPGGLEVAAASPPQGLEALRLACLAACGVPVFALGGVTRENASDCLDAGATGVAGIRLFAGDEWRQLRSEEDPSS
jgi:thiamine-phosphate pyrophosphorylase